MGVTVLVSPGKVLPVWKHAVIDLGIDLPDEAEMNRRVLIRLGVPDVMLEYQKLVIFTLERWRML